MAAQPREDASRTSRSTPAGLEREVRQLVHDAWRALSREPWLGLELETTAEALHAPVQRVCASARDRGVPIERLLIALKAAWRLQAGMSGLSRADAEDMLACVITRCIKEYYRSSVPS